MMKLFYINRICKQQRGNQHATQNCSNNSDTAGWLSGFNINNKNYELKIFVREGEGATLSQSKHLPKRNAHRQNNHRIFLTIFLDAIIVLQCTKRNVATTFKFYNIQIQHYSLENYKCTSKSRKAFNDISRFLFLK